MIDNKPLEKQAENYVWSQLLKYGFNVMKPSFDKKGSDLVIIDNIEKQNSRLLKVQCKGRTVSEKPTNVRIPKPYVLNDFILFIYTVDIDKNESCCMFLPMDIKLWKSNKNEFILTFDKNKISSDYFKSKLLNNDSANLINQLLLSTDIFKYTTLIIDGLFLERAIMSTALTYLEIWPEKKLNKPELNKLIEIILNKFDRFKSDKKGINCFLLISNTCPIENTLKIDYSNMTFKSTNGNQIRIFINRTNEIIAMEVIEQIEKLVNNDNLILVADDLIYESELNRFRDAGFEMILVKMHGDAGSMIVHYKWGDIMYPIGIAMGLEEYEL